MSPLLWNQNPAGYINDNPLFRMTGYYGRLLSKEGFSSLISIITLWTSELLRYHLMASSFWSFGSAIFAFAVAAGLTIITGVYRRRLHFLMEYTSSLIWCIFVAKKFHFDYIFCPGKSRCLQTEEIWSEKKWRRDGGDFVTCQKRFWIMSSMTVRAFLAISSFYRTRVKSRNVPLQ